MPSSRKLTYIPEPLSFPIIPSNHGLNTSVNSQAIDMKESPGLWNMRNYKGQVTTRSGFKVKYFGGHENLLLLDYLYATDQTQILAALSSRRIYQAVGSQLLRLPVYTGAGTGTFLEGTSPLDVFKMTIPNNWWNFTTGKTRVQPFDINAGNIWPNSSDFGDLFVVCNDTDGIIIAAVTSAGPEAETLKARSGTAPISARGVTFYGGRLVALAPKGAGGFTLASYIQWSAVGRADLWAAADGAGAQLIGDESDAIQAAIKLGEYLIVYKARSIYVGNQTFFPSSPFNFVAAPNQAIGLAAPLTIGELGEEHIFLGWDNVYKFSLSGIKTIGDSIKDDLLRGIDGIVPQFLNTCVGIIAEEFDEYWLFVPTGKSPSYNSGNDIKNWCPNPTMELAEVSGSTTSGNATITLVSSGDLSLISIGDVVSGAGIPSGSSVISKGANQFTISQNSTKTTVKNKILVIPGGPPLNQWTIVSNGPGTLKYLAGGNFGPYFNRIQFVPIMGQPISNLFPRLNKPFMQLFPRLNRPAVSLVGSSGNFVTLRSGTIDFTTSVVGHDISVLAWIRADTPCVVKLTINQESGSQLYSRVLNLVATAQFVPYVFDATILAGGGEQHFTIDIELDTAYTKLDVDAVQVVDLGSANSDYVDNVFIDQSQGYRALAAKGIDGKPEMIPFVIDRIGGWASDTVWVFNYSNESWWKWRLPVNGFGFDTLISTIRIADLVGTVAQQTWRFDEKLLLAFAPSNLISSSDGQIYEVSKAYNTDWTGLLDRPILNYWQSKDFDLGRPDIDKTFSRLIIHHEPSHPANQITVSVSTDSGTNWLDQAVTIRTGHDETYADFFVTGTQVRFKVQASSGMFLNGFSVKVIARGEAHAY